MMWSYDGFIAKAQVYFKRADEHPRGDDDEFGIWLLLGLEFLLRAPLARVNPLLLADPKGDALMHAAGFPGAKGNSDPKSISTRTVIERLPRIVDGFTEVAKDATAVVGRRNHEIHSSEPALSVDTSIWLPKFTRVVEVVAAHLGLDPLHLVGRQIIELGRSLVADADEKLQHEIRVRIRLAKEAFEGLDIGVREERLKRRPRSGSPMQEACPACQTSVPVEARLVRTTNQRVEDEEIFEDDEYVVTAFKCPVCGFHLDSTAEVRCADLQQRHVLTTSIDVGDLYEDTYEPDYGND